MNNFIDALDFKQGDKTILLMKLTAGELKELSYYNTRDVDREDGLQRKFDNNRSNQIADFVNSENALLVNNIIINLELEKNGLTLKDIYENSKFNIGLLINHVREKKVNSEYDKIAFVVDGQHRLRAFEKINKDDFALPVSVLLDLSLAEVAELFVQINYNQKPVNKSHVFDLLGISEKIFPKYYLSHKAIVLLQEDTSSPFYNKIKMLGVGKGFISQSAIITAIEKYKLENTITSVAGSCDENLIYLVLWHFFTAIKKLFGDHWGEKKLLSKTVGIKALIRILNDMLKIFFEKGTEFSAETIELELSKINKMFFDQEVMEHLVGEKGVSTLYKELAKELGINEH